MTNCTATTIRINMYCSSNAAVQQAGDLNDLWQAVEWTPNARWMDVESKANCSNKHRITITLWGGGWGGTDHFRITDIELRVGHIWRASVSRRRLDGGKQRGRRDHTRWRRLTRLTRVALCVGGGSEWENNSGDEIPCRWQHMLLAGCHTAEDGVL